MKKNPYHKFTAKELILRDHLAIDRTAMSNESTLLSYIRTSLAIIAAGATLIHFFSEFYIHAAGLSIIVLGLVLLICGYIRFKKIDKLIKEIKRS